MEKPTQSVFKPKIIFMMGVSGSGKSFIGRLLAKELSVNFIDGDDHHSTANIKKMSTGIPLTDGDREPWLDQLRQIATEHLNTGCVIACSALKKKYRVKLAHNIESDVQFVYLKGSYDQIFERMQKRNNHFMDAKMLQSQFEALEEPTNAIEINIADKPKVILKKLKNVFKMKAEIGVLGMGVMGKSLSRNLATKGFKVALYNRHVEGKEENIAVNFKASYPELKQASAHDQLKEFTNSLNKPRKILLMVNAGPTVDMVLNDLKKYLEKGDIIIDGGNSHFHETNRRLETMKEDGIYFIGMGVSGGEEGALKGPSMMPSGDQNAYLKIKNFVESIAAKDENQQPCCTYIGAQGSGHFVKMIHNGIEYAEMQLLAECYAILKQQGMANEQIATVFEQWMEDLNSYLLKITIDILRKKQGEDYLLDNILDKAGNKGTGKWATGAIADSGVAATLIPAALFARYLSFFKEERQQAALLFNEEQKRNDITVIELKKAYQFSRIINHHQGFLLIDTVSKQNNWQVDLSEIARIWTEGCIIKSDLMKSLKVSLKSNPSILFDKKWNSILKQTHSSIQSVVMKSIQSQIHSPCMTEAITYFHGVKTADGSANLIQAQRDYFGAHTYQRKNDESGKNYHTEWSE